MGLKNVQHNKYELHTETNKEELKQAEILQVLEQSHEDMHDLKSTIDDQDFASADNIVAQFEFLQHNPTLSDLIEKHKFHIDHVKKKMSFGIVLVQGKQRKDYDIEISKDGLSVNGEVVTPFLDGHFDQQYTEKNSKVLFKKIQQWFKESGVIHSANADTLQSKVQQKIEDASKVFHALIEQSVQ